MPAERAQQVAKTPKDKNDHVPIHDTAERCHEVAVKQKGLLVAPLCGATYHQALCAIFG